MSNKSIHVLVLMLFMSSLVFCQVQEKILVKGIAVDSSGKPVAGAIIIYSPGPWADIMTGAVADDLGRFELNIGGISDENSLWITGPTYSENSSTFIEAGINLDPKYLIGKKLMHLKRDDALKIIDLGKVPILVSYTPIKILFSGKDRKKYFDPNLDLWVRILDADGEVADNGTGGRGYDCEGGSLTISLPDGEWTIEVSTDDENWETVAKGLTVSGEKEMQIKFSSK